MHPYFRRFGSRKTLLGDLKSGIVQGVVSIPDGLAAGVIAGVNPLFGLYGSLVGRFTGALATGSLLMTVHTTGALAVIVSDVPETQTGNAAATTALTTLTVLSGIVMLALGLARAGSLVRFIPNAVLVGFIHAVAVSIVLSQLDTLTGYQSSGSNRLAKALDTLLHPGQFAWPSVAVGVGTIAIVFLLTRTRVGALGLVCGVALASAAAALLPAAGVPVVSSIAVVPGALPPLTAPDLGLTLSLLLPAVSIALVAVVQGAAISGTVPNPNGRHANPSSDFRGQGIANIAAGLLHGMPVGGSMSATALSRSAGARSALANVVAGLVMLTLILCAAPLIGAIALPALAGILMLVAVQSMRPQQLIQVWRTGRIQATVLSVTFVVTLLIPLQYAVLVGVGLALILHVTRQSNRIVVKQWEFTAHSPLPLEHPAPHHLTPGTVTVLVPYGSLFFASAATLAAQLPLPADPETTASPASPSRTAVVLRLRGIDDLGGTVIHELVQYSARLRDRNGLLVLAGLSPRVAAQLSSTGARDALGAANLFAEQPRVGDALQAARTHAQRWITEPQIPTTPHPTPPHSPAP